MQFPVMSGKQFEDTKGSNQNPLIEEGHTTQWQKKDKRRPTKHYTNDRVKRTPLKTKMSNLQVAGCGLKFKCTHDCDHII